MQKPLNLSEIFVKGEIAIEDIDKEIRDAYSTTKQIKVLDRYLRKQKFHMSTNAFLKDLPNTE